MEENIDLISLWSIFRKNFLKILAITLVTTLLALGISLFLIPKKYESSALLYVENTNSATETINYNDLQVAQKLANTCQILFTSDNIYASLIDSLGLSYTKKQLEKIITVAPVNNTEIMEITVETKSAEESALIASKLSELSQNEFKRVIKSGSIEVVAKPEINQVPSSPNVQINTLIGFFAGFILSYLAFFLANMFDVKVKASDNLTEMYDIPVLGDILDFESKVKGGYNYERS